MDVETKKFWQSNLVSKLYESPFNYSNDFMNKRNHIYRSGIENKYLS